MESQVQNHNSPHGVYGEQSDTKADFLSEQSDVTDFVIKYMCNVSNWLYCRLQTKYEAFFELTNDNVDQ